MLKHYSQHNQNPDTESFMEKPDPTLLIENTGVEPLKKTIHRLMVAGMNLYDHDRGAYTVGDPDSEENKEMPFMTKWDDEKDVKMRMREIQRRLKNKVRSENRNPQVPEVNPESGTMTEPEKVE